MLLKWWTFVQAQLIYSKVDKSTYKGAKLFFLLDKV